jgi:hypothetical protein
MQFHALIRVALVIGASTNAIAEARRMVDSSGPTTGSPTEYAKCSRD